MEESFGPDALIRADRAVPSGVRPSRPNSRRRMSWSLVPHWRRRRRAGRALLTAPVPAATGLHQTCGARPTDHIPFTPSAKESLVNTLREAKSERAPSIGVEHLALGLIAVDNGLVRAVLSALDASAPALRTAIADRNRQAG